jgi:hypothetical protein
MGQPEVLLYECYGQTSVYERHLLSNVVLEFSLSRYPASSTTREKVGS